MYIARSKWPSKDGRKVYESVWLRESYREGGRVKTRDIANLKSCSSEEIEAMELALKHKENLNILGDIDDVETIQGPSVGALWAVFQIAKKIGLVKALGADRQGQLALWQVIARVLDQGSRLSAVRLAETQAATSILDLERGFCEDDLYRNLTWAAENQEKIENRLFKTRKKPNLFLYDVTSSYLEGDQNALGDWGYNRDKKKGKKQIVIGMLCDDDGQPVSTQAFHGNTADLATFKEQVDKATERFGCEAVTFVGDRGMIKSCQIKDLTQAGFNYITAITKAQIRSMIKTDVFQLGLFDEKICEVESGGTRYILRRNPIRAAEMAKSRSERIEKLKAMAEEQTQYLAAHPKADEYTAWKKVSDKHSRFNLGQLALVTAKERTVKVSVDGEYLAKISELDGCYALKTDLSAVMASKEVVHDRYKDLALVENTFRTCKTAHLELRPINVRTEANTRGHVLVVMLAFMIIRGLRKAWAGFDLTVEEGLDKLKTLSAVELIIKGRSRCLRIPAPDKLSSDLLTALDVQLPEVLPLGKVRVGTRKKLQTNRKQ